MPQLDRDGDDLGANDELIAFKDEGEQEDKPSVSSERDLDDVKSSLVNESEATRSSDSEADRRPKPHLDTESRTRHSQLFQEGLRRQQDAGLFQPSPYVGYPFFMIPDLGNLCSPYLTNGALASSGRTYLPFQWPLLDIPGRASIRDSATPTHLANGVPVVQHPHLHPLLSYSPEAFSPQRASPGFSPEPGKQPAGMSRSPHTACYPVSPGGMTPIPHPLGWLPGQPMYPITGGFSPAALAMNASMTGLMSSSFSQRLVPTSQSSVPHSAIVPAAVKQEPGCSSSQQPGKSSSSSEHDKEEERKPHIKKPLNAFMLYMREERPKVVAQCKVKESATINQILGQRWHSLSKEEQARYYDLARKERLLHSKLYPNWSARDNYGKKKKRKRMKSDTQLEVTAAADCFPPQLKRTREETPYTPLTQASHSPLTQASHTPLTQASHTPLTQASHTPLTQASHTRSQLTHPHTMSHLTHTHLSQASPASSLDSPATPTTALASPAGPAATHTEHTHSSYSHSGHSSPYGEQLQPLSLTTKPQRSAQSVGRNITPGPSTPSSTDTPSSSPPTASCRRSPQPLPLASHPFLLPPPTSHR